ncbi:MAG: DMT family transporter [Desulfobacterales bacterium]|nr:DMT family transporter [Desulfobacterales bacterium]MDJ0876082.1 DMT family transporter [Desulfobacterales bacterium]MDJ0885111.1 DMT family transporter [Desulfobacterales bacterium]
MIATYLKLLGMAVFWGGTFIAGKLAAQNVGPYSAAFLRFAIASGFLLLAAWKIEGRLPAVRARQLLPIFLLGLTGVLAYNVFFFKGLKLIEAGRAAIIIANNPIGIALFSALIFRERLTPLRLAGILVSISGAVLVITRGSWSALGAGAVGWGELFILGCVASWVTFSLLGKALLAEMSPLASVLYASLSGAACLALPAWQEGILAALPEYALVDWLALFYLGFFGTVLGFVWYYQGIQRIGATKAGVFINFVPISAIIFSFFILDEPLTMSLLGGTLLVLTGVYLTNRPAPAVK